MLLDPIKDFFRPVLSDREIVRRIQKGELFESHLSPIQIQPNSVDLTLSKSVSTIRTNDMYDGEPIINLGKRVLYAHQEMQPGLYHRDEFHERNIYKVSPGEFVLMASNEILRIPRGIVAFVQGRSSIARLGIQTEQAGLIDSGFRGTITFEVYNESPYPIYLMENMRVAQVYFFKAMFSKRLYGSDLSSKYNGQIYATGSKIHLDIVDTSHKPIDHSTLNPIRTMKTDQTQHHDR